MAEYRWISCGQAAVRVELFGEYIERGQDSDVKAPDGQLVSIAGIRVRNYVGSAKTLTTHEVIHLDIEETILDAPILLKPISSTTTVSEAERPLLSVDSIPQDLILEGMERPDHRFLDLVVIKGWKLELKKSMQVGWYLLGDWEFDTHPDYFPGATLGEVSLVGTFGGKSTDSLKIEMPWPFSTAARLSVRAPTRGNDGQWNTGLALQDFASIFDGAGAALKNFSLGKIDLSSSASLSDSVYVRSGINANGDVSFDIVISAGENVPFIEFGGQKLALTSGAELVLNGSLGSTHLALNAGIALKPKTGFTFIGPLATKLIGESNASKEIVSLIGANVPGVKLNFRARKQIIFPLGQAQLPLRWDSTPLIKSATNVFENLELTEIDGTGLKGFYFGSIEGDSPHVKLQIEAVEYESPIGLRFTVQLQIQASAEELPVLLKGTWRFAFDLATLSFIPGRTIELEQTSQEFHATGLYITGLKSLSVMWLNGQLDLTASNLKAFFGGITDPSDPSPGFELDVLNLKIGAGGLDLELAVAGGVTKVAGIGEFFKGVKGNISIVGSRFQSGFITAEGPLPWLDNATGSITLMFKEGLQLDQVKSEFQLGVHRRVDWWLELDLKTVRIDIDHSTGRAMLILMITGTIEIKPPAEGGIGAIAAYLASAKLEFKDLVLTKAFSSLPANVSLLVGLAKPAGVVLLEAFGLEMRSIGIGPGDEPGEGALVIGGQIFFSSNDTLDVRVDFHKISLQKPAPGSLVPRVGMINLGVRFKVDAALELEGFVSLFDTPERRGFMGYGKLMIAETFGIGVLLEFSRVRRTSDGEMVRVWMVYADWLEANILLIGGIFLRDVGLGFGWRKTLATMEDPTLLLSDPGKNSRTLAPHLPTSWIDDLEGADPHWTVVMSAWLTLGLPPRNEVALMVGDVLFAFRSDLTIVFAYRGWVFASLEGIRASERSARPFEYGLVYFSPRQGHLLASFVTDPGGAAPEGIPPALIEALIGSPFNLTIEIRPGLFRLELGWPRQLSMQFGIFRGRAGLLCRITDSALTIGLGMEVGLGFSSSFALDLGIAELRVGAEGAIAVYGEIIARIGSEPALYGTVGVNAVIRVFIGFYVNFKLGFIRIKFSIEFSFELILSARLSFGISGSGFGLEGYAGVSLRIWKFSIGAEIAIVVNKGALDDARRKVYAGLNAGTDAILSKKVRALPDGKGIVPAVSPSRSPRWSVFFIQPEKEQDTTVYVLLLPKEDTWFATPVGGTLVGESDIQWAGASVSDYEFVFDLKNTRLLNHLGNPAQLDTTVDHVEIKFNCDWNKSVGTMDPEANSKLGDWFFESLIVQKELRQIEAILQHPNYTPELLQDWRVRAEKDAQADQSATSGLRPDVRSPHFASDGDLYDLALERAIGSEPGDTLSWHRISLSQTKWPEKVSPEFLSEIQVVRPTTQEGFETQEGYAFKEKLFTSAERLIDNHGTLVARLLHEFRAWARAGASDSSLDLLTNSGLAFKFNITSPDWQITLNSLKVNRGNGVIDSLPAAQITNASIMNGDGGLGFATASHRYRLRDIIEFQDPDAVHFSWLLECIDSSNTVHTMMPEEISGLASKQSYFEFFDHYEITRRNLSSQEGEKEAMASFKVQPAFVPSLLDIGAGVSKFFLVAPRFDFSDQFQTPAEIGDLLLYEITAVDVFGNRSQTTAHLTSRKQLNPPPPPDSGRALYEVALTPNSVESEQLTFSVQPAKEISAWQGGAIRYEVWGSSQPLVSGGYYGMGNDIEETIESADNQPIINPKGMTLIRALTTSTAILTSDDLSVLGYGQAYAFYVRAVSSEGNASRLVRCSHVTRVSRTGQNENVPERSQGYFERLPPPSSEAVSWMSVEDMRFEVQHAKEPQPNDDQEHKFVHVDVDDPTQRELTLRLLHRAHVDAVFQHPTGGYEVFVRDRDATALDQKQDYRRLAEIEVVTPERYRKTPPTSDPWMKWHGRYLQLHDFPALQRSPTGQEIDLGYLDWGDELIHDYGAPLVATFPEGLRIHGRLKQLLIDLQEESKLQGYRLVIYGGPARKEELEELSFARLLEDNTEEKDPHGNGLLKRLGRAVDVAFIKGSAVITTNELLTMLNGVIIATAGYYKNDQVVLEMLFNSDRRSQMGYYRITLQPRLRSLPLPIENPKAREDNRRAAFKSFESVLRNAGINTAGILDLGAQENYEGLVRRFLRQHPLTNSRSAALGVAYYEDSGSFRRPLNPDETIAIQIYYDEPYARRFAYRIQRLSRYLPLYRELGLWSGETIAQAGEDQTLLVRLPRVKAPAPPVTRFLGNFDREEIPSSEWLIEEHEEEAMVQSNETLRNRLGYRGIAWSLFAETIPSWEEWSGWRHKTDWATRGPSVDDGGVPGLSDAEKVLMATDASWPEPAPAMFERTGLGWSDHPFTGLLTPKGMVVRMPKLPYYYRYRIGAFARTDDIDSVVRLVDASRVFPSQVPNVNLSTAGWKINQAGEVEIWWRIPSAWDSLDETERGIWANEKPYASRLWDFDLKYNLQIRRQGVLMPLVYLRPVPPESDKPIPPTGNFTVQTAASYLYKEKSGQVEFLDPIQIPSPFRPELSLTLGISEVLKSWILVEDDFVFELRCFRTYGNGKPSVNLLPRSKALGVTR